MKPYQNENEFMFIVRKYKATIYTVCYMFSSNEAEIDDLFQEIMINIWKGLASFEGKSDIKTWIYRVALNTCITQDKKKKRQKTESLSMNISPFIDSDIDSKQMQALNHRISRLNPFDRAIVLLWLENMSYEEIGLVVGISTKNVSVRLFRIKEQLKKMKD